VARNKKNKFIENAQKHLQKQNFEKALKEYLKAHQEDPKDVRVAQKLGELYQKTGNKKEAAKFYKLAGSIYSRDGFHQKAIAAYKHILDIDPNHNEIRLEIAGLYRKLGLMAEAKPQFKEALKFYEEQGDRDKVLEILRNLVELEPRSVNHRIKLAEMYLKGGQREQGYNEFKRAAEELKSAGRWDDLAKLYERLVKADPGNVDNITGYAEVLIEKGDFPRAVKFYEQALKYRPEDTQILEKIVNACTRSREADKAVTYLKKKAEIHEKNGENGEAAKCYQKIVRLHPNDEQAKSHLDELGVGEEKAPAAPSGPAGKKEEEEIEALPPDEDEELEPVALEEEPPEVSAPAAKAEPPRPPSEPAVAPVTDTEDEATDIPTEEQIPGLLTEADVYLRYGLLDKAGEYIKRVLRAKPDKHEALFLDGLLHKEQGRIEEAVESMMMAVSSAKASEDLAEARSYLEEVLALDPANSRAKSLQQELNAGIEIDIGVEEEEEEELVAVAEDEDTLTLQADEEEFLAAEEGSEQIELRPEEDEEEPFSFVEEAGDEELLLVDDEAAPAPEAPAPAPQAEEEPLFEVEGGEEAPAFEMEVEEEAPAAAEAPVDAPVFEEIEEEEGEVELEEIADSAFDELAEEASRPPEEAEVERAGAVSEGRDLDSVLEDEWEEEELGEEVIDQAAEEYAVGLEGPPEKEPPIALEEEETVGRVEEAAEAVAEEAEEEMLLGASASEDLGPEPMMEETAEEAPEIAVSEEQEIGAADIHAIADASEEAWGDAIMEEEPPPSVREAPRHDLEGIDEEADQVFGDMFGEETGERGAELFNLSGVLDEEEEPAEAARTGDAADDLGEVLSSFRERVREEYGEDAETHFNLGIAYKEMGLYRDAIQSFKTAMKAGYNPSDALNMAGLCFMDLGEYEKAEKVFNEGLSLQGLQEHEILGLRFDLGLALEKQGRQKEALESYREVEAINPHFRDVSEHIREVEEALAPKEEKARPAKSKISYI